MPDERKVTIIPVGDGSRIHSPEIVEYPQWGEFLLRCHTCGARLWARSEQEVNQLRRAHARAPWEEAKPKRVHAVVSSNDKGTETKVTEFDTADAALRFIESGVVRQWGWSYAYLTGFRSPRFLAHRLTAGLETPAIADADVVEYPELPDESWPPTPSS